MIEVTTPTNEKVILNCELIRSIEAKPHTVVTLVNGEKWIVQEESQELIARTIEYHRQVRQNSDSNRRT